MSRLFPSLGSINRYRPSARLLRIFRCIAASASLVALCVVVWFVCRTAWSIVSSPFPNINDRIEWLAYDLVGRGYRIAILAFLGSMVILGTDSLFSALEARFFGAKPENDELHAA